MFSAKVKPTLLAFASITDAIFDCRDDELVDRSAAEDDTNHRQKLEKDDGEHETNDAGR